MYTVSSTHYCLSEEGNLSYMTLPGLSFVAWPGYFWVCQLSQQLGDIETKTRSLVVRRARVSCVTMCSHWPDIKTLVSEEQRHIRRILEFAASGESSRREVLRGSGSSWCAIMVWPESMYGNSTRGKRKGGSIFWSNVLAITLNGFIWIEWKSWIDKQNKCLLHMFIQNCPQWTYQCDDNRPSQTCSTTLSPPK